MQETIPIILNKNPRYPKKGSVAHRLGPSNITPKISRWLKVVFANSKIAGVFEKEFGVCTINAKIHHLEHPRQPSMPRTAPPGGGGEGRRINLGFFSSFSGSSSPPMASADVEFRCFFGGLAWVTDDHALKDAFSQYGHCEILESKIISDPRTRPSLRVAATARYKREIPEAMEPVEWRLYTAWDDDVDDILM
ncbi:hypothetical protein QJS10_CPB21g00430 [Acorus calamus]|uniref:RRM domain-containing protein n=1 Tax=Acorus calamus TaxID=4465 RepID=A0AAV9C6K4_ACOCL|nr:hypothetical protein QJS10_CPB21g00430 [Acorus calamus]